MPATDILLAVHGGAGNFPKRALSSARREAYEQGLADALLYGWRVLKKGGSALNAVTDAVCCLEDNELFNAGRGSVLSANGRVELSASVMNGADLSAGAMVGLRKTKNPIRAARLLLDHPHGLLFGTEAEKLAADHGLDMKTAKYFVTDRRATQWRKRKGTGAIALDHESEDARGTVGAVARDRRGNLAAATSTGGMTNQMPGRVGDTPIVGAGTWADNKICALSATGKGDAFARIAFARRVADLIDIGKVKPAAAAVRALKEVKAMGGDGGCILVTKSGTCSMPFNSTHMLRGWIGRDGKAHVAIAPDEGRVVAHGR